MSLRIRDKKLVGWAVVVLGIETISLLTIFQPLPNTIATVIVGLVVLYLSWKKPTLAIAMLVLELLIGSKGYLLQVGGWPSHISLRIVLTAAFGLGWMLNVWQAKAIREVWKRFLEHWRYWMLYVLILYAVMRGFVLHNQFMFADANAWGDWLLLLPILDIAHRYRERIRQDILPVFYVGIAWLGLETLLLEYIFSHGFQSISSNLYLWVRRTGVGEVTLIVGNAFRIFMQSYVYALPVLIFSIAWFLGRANDENPETARLSPKKMAWFFIVIATSILGISLSRSFWMGTFFGLVCVLALTLRSHRIRIRQYLAPFCAGVAGLVCIATVLAFPVPRVEITSLQSLFGSRTDMGEAAAKSRWKLLPVLWEKIKEHPIVGSGFGATVTYETFDPRILSETPNGTYTTYAFEWGWLEHWIKFGIFGIPLILFLLISLGRRVWRLNEPKWIRIGGVSSVVGLGVLHIFTPYLNHPLGFLFLFIGEIWIQTGGDLDKK